MLNSFDEKSPFAQALFKEANNLIYIKLFLENLIERHNQQITNFFIKTYLELSVKYNTFPLATLDWMIKLLNNNYENKKIIFNIDYTSSCYSCLAYLGYHNRFNMIPHLPNQRQL